jgi:hypothetical protein
LAHHARHPARPEGVGDLVPAVHVAGHGGQADQVRLQVEVDRLDVLVGQHHLVAVARNARRDGEQARERRVESPVEIQWARGQRIRGQVLHSDISAAGCLGHGQKNVGM